MQRDVSAGGAKLIAAAGRGAVPQLYVKKRRATLNLVYLFHKIKYCYLFLLQNSAYRLKVPGPARTEIGVCGIEAVNEDKVSGV
ncbi:MAG TPA: hypothetical protein PKI81_07125, partial [bacterium]|nr:hypothetical protein [bacterium]